VGALLSQDSVTGLIENYTIHLSL